MRVFLPNFAMPFGATSFGMTNVAGFDTFSNGYVEAGFSLPYFEGLKPAVTLFAPNSNGSGAGSSSSGKLQERIQKLAEHGIEVSRGFSRMMLNGDMQPQFAEMLILGLIARISKKETPSNEMIKAVIGKIRENGYDISGYFSRQFNTELSLAERTIEDYFEIATIGGKTSLAMAEEPAETEPETEPSVLEEIEVEILSTADEPTGGRAMVWAGEMAGAGRAGSALAVLPSRVELSALGLPAGALHAMAKVSPELAQHSITGMLQLDLSTDPQKIADALRVIRKLYKFAVADEKEGMLGKLADIYLMYNEALKTEAVENARRIRREVIAALQEIGIRRDFVRELETFTNGTESNKAISLQGLAAFLHDGNWEGDNGAVKFAKYLIVRLVLAEIKDGSSAEILSAALDSVHVIAVDIIAEGETDEFVSNLVIRAGAKDVSEEGSVVYLGLRALLNVNRSAAIAAMEPQLKGNLFRETDVLIYRLLVQYYEDPEKRRFLAKRMVSDHVKIARMERAIRQTLREAIVRIDEAAIPFIIAEYKQAEAAKLLSPERREDLIRMVFEIYAGLTREQRRELPLEIRAVVFERAADKLFLEYRTSQAVLDGVSSLDEVHGQELLAFYKAKADAFGISQQEKVFWIKQMAGKVGTLEMATPVQAGNISWAFTETLRLFEDHGTEYFETVCNFFSSPAVPFKTIKPAFDRISASPRSSKLPERDRAVLIAMAGNCGLPKEFLAGTVGKKLEEIAGKIFSSESAAGELAFTEKGLAEDVASVVLELDHESDVSIGEELRKALIAFVKERKGRYGFDPSNGKLSIKGEMSASDQAVLSRILGVTHKEKIRIGKLELPERIDQRQAQIGFLNQMAAEKARRSKETAVTMGTSAAATFFLDDADMASDLSDSPPLKRFEDAVEGLARLCKNTQLGRAEKDYYLEKLMKLHDRAVREASQGATDLGSSDSWSYAVVRPLVEIFVGGALGRSAAAANAFSFIFSNLIGGHLSTSSRRSLWGLFTKQLGRFNKVPSLIFLITGRLCDAIARKPQAEWTAEKEFLVAILGSFGENGSVKPGMLSASQGLEDRIQKLLTNSRIIL